MTYRTSMLFSIFKSRLVKNGLWLLLLQFFNMVAPLLTLPYITRVLSEADFGSFSLALNWVGYLQVIVEYGFALYGTRKVATCSDDRELSEIGSSIFFARWLLMILCLGVFALCINFLPMGRVQIGCMMILFVMVLSSVFQQTWLFHGLSDMKSITIINMISRLVSVVCIFAFVKDSDDIYWYSLFYGAHFLLARGTEFFVATKKFNVSIHCVQLKLIFHTIKDAAPLFMSSAMTRIFSNVGITILGFVASEESVGAYSAIAKIPYVLTLLFGAVSQAIYPSMCKAHEESFDKGLLRARHYGIPIVLLFTFGGIVLASLHKPIVSFVFGQSYAQYSSLLVPLVCWVVFGIVNNFLGVQTLIASGHQKQYSFDFSISLIAMLVFMVSFGRAFEGYGIAIASMMSEIFLTILLSLHIRRVKVGKE